MDAFNPNADAFRFYADGTESGSSPLAAQDTDISRDLTAGDVPIHLRYRVQEDGAGSLGGASTDDYQLQHRLNGGGSWVDVTASALRVQADTGSGLTDDAATTNRAVDPISDGTGSFFAGIQEEGDGEITDFQHEADNFTEHVWALLLIAADFVNGDFVEFRIQFNGGNPGMDNDVTPRCDIEIISGDAIRDPILGSGVIPFAR